MKLKVLEKLAIQPIFVRQECAKYLIHSIVRKAANEI